MEDQHKHQQFGSEPRILPSAVHRVRNSGDLCIGFHSTTIHFDSSQSILSPNFKPSFDRHVSSLCHAMCIEYTKPKRTAQCPMYHYQKFGWDHSSNSTTSLYRSMFSVPLDCGRISHYQTFADIDRFQQVPLSLMRIRLEDMDDFSLSQTSLLLTDMFTRTHNATMLYREPKHMRVFMPFVEPEASAEDKKLYAKLQKQHAVQVSCRCFLQSLLLLLLLLLFLLAIAAVVLRG